MSIIRYSTLNNRYVIIAPERLKRPIIEEEINKSAVCPFCRGNEYMTTKPIYTLNGKDGWILRVIPNLYKALQIETKNEFRHIGIFEEFGGFGAHEIIIDTNRHISKMSDFRLQEYINLFETIKLRVADLKNDSRIVYLSIFKNIGKNGGASIEHTHTQIIGMPLMPTLKVDLYNRKYNFYKEKGRKLLRDVIDEELRSGDRILLNERGFIAYLPFASSFPFEIIIAPKADISTILYFDEVAIYNLSIIMQKVINTLYKSLGNIPFNLSLINPPINPNFQNSGYFYEIDKISLFAIRIMPRLYGLAGFEVSEGMVINPVSPEFGIKILKENL